MTAFGDVCVCVKLQRGGGGGGGTRKNLTGVPMLFFGVEI